MAHSGHLGLHQQRLCVLIHPLRAFLELLATQHAGDGGKHELQCCDDRGGDYLQYRVLSYLGEEAVFGTAGRARSSRILDQGYMKNTRDASFVFLQAWALRYLRDDFASGIHI